MFTPRTRKITNLLGLLNDKSGESIDLVSRAYSFARTTHDDITRKSGEPYIHHLFQTACYLAELGMPACVVAAGLLHDTVEDTDVTPADIEAQFGSHIKNLVIGVTKLGTSENRLERRAKTLKRMFRVAARDVSVIIVKLMDRLHNIQTLSSLCREKRERIARETLEIYAPIADLLGMSTVRSELEDGAFACIDRRKYDALNDTIAQFGEAVRTEVEELKRNITRMLKRQHMRDVTVEERLKDPYSLYRKLKRKGGDLDRVHDLLVVRVVVSEVSQCYQVLKTVHDLKGHVPGRVKDYFAFPKANGYQSIHTTLVLRDGRTIEVQIRTVQSHYYAQFGIVSELTKKQHSKKHRLYKYLHPWRITRFFPSRTTFDAGNPLSIAVPEWIKRIAELPHKKEPDVFINEIKEDFFNTRILTFTPKGDLIELPIGASPIDFAYALGVEMGNCICGAKVNQKKVPLSTRLRNGDIVEIATKETRCVESGWMDYVKTTHARRCIQNILYGHTTSNQPGRS